MLGKPFGSLLDSVWAYRSLQDTHQRFGKAIMTYSRLAYVSTDLYALDVALPQAINLF